MKGKTCSRTQFPLVVSYAITVHKSQGVTLPQVVCDISEREFASGLSYVAISRASRLDGLMFDVPFDRDRVYRVPAQRGDEEKASRLRYTVEHEASRAAVRAKLLGGDVESSV